VVPWSSISLNQDLFLEHRFLPSSVKLIEISKMKTEELHACVRHWYDRTANGKVAFRFKTVRDADLRVSSSKKRRPAPPSDDEHGDEDEPGDEDERGDEDEHGNEDELDEDDPVGPGARSLSPQDDKCNEEVTLMASKFAEVNPGKGKSKAIPVLWYACLMYNHWFAETETQFCGSPADVQGGAQHQFEFLFSLSKEEEYKKLIKQAAEVPVCPIFLFISE